MRTPSLARTLLLPAAVAAVSVVAGGHARAGVCDPSMLVNEQYLCYGDGGFSNPSNVAGATYSPTTPFVQGSEICFSYDVTASIEQGGYDQVMLRFTDDLGGISDVCLAGVAAGDCGPPSSDTGGCLNFPAVVYELQDTVCYAPQTGASEVTASVFVQPIDLGFQCGDVCDAGGTLGVSVHALSVTGCSGFATGSCGNGIVDSGEGCDDGNTIALDGCDQACQLEAGGICSADLRTCGGADTCAPVTPGSLATSYCYSDDSDLDESTLSWTWHVDADGRPYDLYWEIEGGVELFHGGRYDSLWLTWQDDLGTGETFFVNDGGLFANPFYETWSRASRRIVPAAGADTVKVTFWVQSDSATSCQAPKADAGPTRELAVTALTLSSCDVGAQYFDTLAEFTDAMGGCYIVQDFNEIAGPYPKAGALSGDGYAIDVDTNQPGVVLTVDDAPYHTTQAEGDGTVAVEAQGYGDYQYNSRLRISFFPEPRTALGMNVIDAGDGNGVMAVEAYRDGELVYVDNDIDASGDPNNYITWKGILFSEPVDSVVLFMIEGGDFFNIDNLVLSPQQDRDFDGVPDECDCAPDDGQVAGSFTEICDDGIDNDCDLLTDGGDPDCGGTQTAACGVYADEQLTTDNGGWLTSGNQSWRWESTVGAWRAVGAHDIDATLESAPAEIGEGACDEVFKVTIDYGGSTEQGYDLLTTSYAVNGGAFVELDVQSGNLAPKTYSLPTSIDPGDKVSFRFNYTTDGTTLGGDPTISRVRLFSDADLDSDGVCDACDCAPYNASYGADCDADDDGYCGVGVGLLNADPAVAGCGNDTAGGEGTDCDDQHANANPGLATETGFCSDGLDNDCDGPIDGADLPDCEVDDCIDGDGDGFGTGTTCPFGPDCDDTSARCTSDCSDADDDGIPDCRDGCVDVDGDGYGVGPECIAADCNDDVPTCTTDCTTDADSNGVPDCEQDCIDGDGDGYGVGAGCTAPDCDDTTPRCTTDCSDLDQDGVPDCKDDCIDRDRDNYGEGPACFGPDCNDLVPTCTTDCETDVDGGDGNGIPDCEEDCVDGDGDGYGVGPACAGADCDDSRSACTVDCTDTDGDHNPDCSDDDDDNDGLSDQAEATHSTDPLNPDSDGDGLLDGQEVNNHGTNPLDPDSDHDGLEDGDEIKSYGTDPLDPDTDGEGLSDGEEVLTHKTDPTLVDTDAGGMDDFTEVQTGRNPVDFPEDDGEGQLQGNGVADCSAGGGGTPLAVALALLILAAMWRRRRGAASLLALVAVAGLTVVGQAPGARAAGPEGFNVQNFQLKPGVDRVFSVEGSEVAPAWAPYGGLWFHYVDDPLSFVIDYPGRPAQRQRVIENMMQLQLGAGVGLFDIAELELVAPLTLSTRGDDSMFSGLDSGVGDLTVRARVRIIGRQGAELQGFGLNFGVGVGVPIGEGGNGDGGLTLHPKLAATLAVGPVILAANAGVNVRTEAESYENLDFGQELLYGFGVHVQMIDALAIGAEIFGRTQLDNFFADETESPLELVGGLKARLLGGLHFEAGAGFGVVPGYGAPDWRLFAGAQWAPYVNDPDTDGDGIVDSLDRCPETAEDFDDWVDEDGCPELDNDGDGIPDNSDRCPTPTSGVCPDLNPQQLASATYCEDVDGFQDTDGCNDADNDQDGLLDVSDSCPDEPEDKDGFQDSDGCPDPDNDGDGVLDVNDQCMSEPETVNGYQDEDGCPDEVPLARVEGCKIIIGDKIYFRTGRSTIQRKSYPLLDEVARIIKEIDGYDHIMIEGHTDDRGSAGYNRRLSNARAKAVRKYLTRKGISGRKLKAKGFGEDAPIADNATDEGRAQNRRVEFEVVGGTCEK